MLSKALLGLSLLGGTANASPKFELPDPPKMVAQKQSDSNILAATLVMEAGAESDSNAMLAVYNVLQNRSARSGDSLSDEALKPLQFSCWNKGETSRQDRIKSAQSHPKWEEAMEIVRKFPKDITGGATHYHVFRGKRKVTPSWTVPKLGGKNKKAVITKTIGDHVFLKNVD
jgi:hypothetical protein